MTKKTEKQKEDTVDKTEREDATVDKRNEKASKVTQPKEVTKPVDEKIEETVDEDSEERATSDERKVKYVFPNASQCPRCRSHDTIAYRTDGKVQYRKCRRGHCRQRYSIIGLKEK